MTAAAGSGPLETWRRGAPPVATPEQNHEVAIADFIRRRYILRNITAEGDSPP